MAPLPPGSTIGILGTGQLGRMLSIAAAKLGFRTIVYGPDDDPPAAQVAGELVRARYDDEEKLSNFAQRCGVVTFEFENVPAPFLSAIERHSPLRPSVRSLEVSQDRLLEKRFIAGLGQGLARFASVTEPDELIAAVNELGTNTILKTRRMGYDGKGQTRLKKDAPVDPKPILDNIGGGPCVLEEQIDLKAEVSVIVARSVHGQALTYDVPVNVHKNGILHTSSVGQFAAGELGENLRAQAVSQAVQIADALEHIGVLTVEFFVTQSDQLIVNEIAPRVHNSGHWTLDACLHDQFDNHIRAITGLSLGTTRRHSDAQMTNLIGDDARALEHLLADEQLSVHLYGKAEVRSGRKMGHVTRLAPMASPT
ncbi:MAG: 5-(carboxyamino)imidazole ribonucleotide synthase [Pseudomonadota bacterium]